MYRPFLTLEDSKRYLAAVSVVALDSETFRDNQCHPEEKAALDLHKAHIVDISFSKAEGDAIYLPVAYHVGENAAPLPEIWSWLAAFFTDHA